MHQWNNKQVQKKNDDAHEAQTHFRAPALAVETLDPSLARRIELKKVHSFRLDAVPELVRTPPPDKVSSVFEDARSGQAAEQFRLMQRRLTSFCPQGSSALVTSPGASDGKSLNARNLAWALAEAGHSTLLLELDLRRPTQAESIGAQLPASIVSVLRNGVSPASVVRRIGSLPLFYIGLEDPAENPVELLRSNALDELLSWASKNFTWIIIDGPPVLAVADIEELLPKVDLVVMVVRERKTPRALVERAAERLGKRLSFLIFNDVSLTSSYGYGYGYGYYWANQADGPAPSKKTLKDVSR